MDPHDATNGPDPTNGFIVTKVGGRAVEETGVAEGVADLVDRGLRPVVVHGGGVQVTDALADAGIETLFEGGLRVTTDEVLEVAARVFAAVGKELAAAVTAAGAPAVALNGHDAGLIGAEPLEDLGHVGSAETVDDGLLRFLAYNGIVPVVGPPALGPDGQALNVNADDVAAAVAAALGADQLVFLTDVPAVLDAAGEPIDELTVDDALDLGSATDGMGPKLDSAAKAAADGVHRVTIAGAGSPLGEVVRGEATATTVTDGVA